MVPRRPPPPAAAGLPRRVEGASRCALLLTGARLQAAWLGKYRDPAGLIWFAICCTLIYLIIIGRLHCPV